MTASPDWVSIRRSIDKYGDDPIRLKAWLYLILDAEINGGEIGKVKTTWTKLAIRWGLYRKSSRGLVPHIDLAKRIAKEMIKDGRVKLHEQSVSNVRAKREQSLSIFLINYAKLQGKSAEGMSNVRAKCEQSVSNDENEPLPVQGLDGLISNKNKNKKKISDISISQHTKIEKPKQESTNEFRRVTDYMWESYEKKYGVKPDSMANTALFKIFRPLVTEWGEEICKKAWDAWLESEEKIPLECNHSPKTFSSTFWFNKYRVEITRTKTSIWDMSEEDKQARREKDEKEFEVWAEKERQKEEELL